MSSSPKPLRTAITHEGQPYVDEPVYVSPKPVSQLAFSVSAAFNDGQPSADLNKKRLLVGYQMTRLKWMKPDGKGGLKPR